MPVALCLVDPRRLLVSCLRVTHNADPSRTVVLLDLSSVRPDLLSQGLSLARHLDGFVSLPPLTGPISRSVSAAVLELIIAACSLCLSPL